MLLQYFNACYHVHCFNFFLSIPVIALQTKFTVKRKRRDFGEFVEFADNKPTKDAIQECVAFEDKSFDLSRVEMDTGTQVSAIFAIMYERTYFHVMDFQAVMEVLRIVIIYCNDRPYIIVAPASNVVMLY